MVCALRTGTECIAIQCGILSAKTNICHITKNASSINAKVNGVNLKDTKDTVISTCSPVCVLTALLYDVELYTDPTMGHIAEYDTSVLYIDTYYYQ